MPTNRLTLYVVLVAVSVIGTPLLATTARLAALGGGEFIEDDHNVTRWYGSLGDYPDELSLETGHFTLPYGYGDTRGQAISGPGGSIHRQLDPAGRWGTFALYLNAQGRDADPGSLVGNSLGTTVSAIWSRRFGSLQPALAWRRGTDSGSAGVTTPDTTTMSWDRSRNEWGLGLRWDLGDGAYLDLAGEIRRHTEQTGTTGGRTSALGPRRQSAGSVGCRARAFIRLSPTTALIPLLDYVHEERPLSAPTPATAADLRGDLVQLGSGLNWYPDSDHLLLLNLAYINGRTDELSGQVGETLTVFNRRRWQSFSLTVGFETRFRYWLTWRGSMRYETVGHDESTATGATDFASLALNLGAAIHLGTYDLDLALSDSEPGTVSGFYGRTGRLPRETWLTMTLRRTF